MSTRRPSDALLLAGSRLGARLPPTLALVAALAALAAACARGPADRSCNADEDCGRTEACILGRCEPSPGAPPTRDAGPEDAAGAGRADAGPDAGAVDDDAGPGAGADDGGPSEDGGPAVDGDAGALDAGQSEPDGGPADAGAPDAGVVDGGPRYPPRVLADLPLAYYRLDEASGPTAEDSSGGGHDGAFSNELALGVDGAPEVGDGAAVRAAGDTHLVALPSTVDPWRGPFTFEAWVRMDAAPVWRAGLLIREEYLDWGFRFGVDLQLRPVFWATESGGDGEVVADAALALHAWHHVALVVDAGRARIFVDGALVGEGLVDVIAPPSGGGQIGGSNGCPLHGSFDEAALFDRALSQERIAARAAPQAP